jgi:hypothetical protein
MRRSDVSAFTRVFDALCLRRGAVLIRGPYCTHAVVAIFADPGSAAHRRRGLRRAQDTNPDAALTPLSAPRDRCGTFPERCCFQVIYFVSNISFVAAAEPSPKPPWKAFG